MKKRVNIIINPKSGAGKKAGIEVQAKKYLQKELFDIEFYHTKFAGDARKKASILKEENTDIIIAVGGDGTINEVGSQLINSETALAVIPLGSGNGLARHLQIPLNISKAFRLINTQNLSKIDTGTLNGKPFFNVSGIGFDAFVSYIFATLPKRGLSAYIRATWRAFFNFKPFYVEIKSKELKHFSGDCYMVSIANSSQFGNNCYINPLADVADGKVEIAVILPFPRILVPALVYRLFSGNIHKSKYIKTFSVTETKIICKEPVKMHLDGDIQPAETNFEVGVIPSSLKIITPE